MTIKINMEMPKSCNECRFCISSYISYCIAKKPIFPILLEEERAKLNNRPSWCPLQGMSEEEENIIENETGGMTMAKLKPCIWCKGNLLCVTHDKYTDGCVYYVKCRACGAQGPHVFQNEKQAISAWNRRRK